MPRDAAQAHWIMRPSSTVAPKISNGDSPFVNGVADGLAAVTACECRARQVAAATTPWTTARDSPTVVKLIPIVKMSVEGRSTRARRRKRRHETTTRPSW